MNSKTPSATFESASRAGRTDFGGSRNKAKPQRLDERWTNNGDGTISDHEHGLTWIQGAWGTCWDGRQFAGQPERLSWNDATPLFGRGVFAYADRPNQPLTPNEWTQTSVARGYSRGKCTVDFAGHADWRLPTAHEACMLANVGNDDADFIHRELFPGFGISAFLTASGKVESKFLFWRMPSLVWKGWVGGHVNDENPDVAYPILLLRNGANGR